MSPPTWELNVYGGTTLTTWCYKVYGWNGKTDHGGLCPEWALMAYPGDGQDPNLLQHSAGKVILQSPSPAFYQDFNANLGARPRGTIQQDL